MLVEERPDGPVDQARGQRFPLAGATFALEDPGMRPEA
jgi:hypothetical protein